MKGRDVQLVVATMFLLVCLATGQPRNNGRTAVICYRNCADSQCDFHCKRVGYANGRCYQSPFCNPYKNRINCACYRYRQQSSVGKTQPPVILIATVTPPTTIQPSSTISSTAVTSTPLLSDSVSSTLIGLASSISTPIASATVSSISLEPTSVDSAGLPTNGFL
ncbi:unnamed protein product [Candidula unifasciata]|uniref:Uncharacterized protein n=1 Tax=Candidula unifasciata TaxID=100452 RepID=A0A8S3ZQE0_9EUPU|nr:unnamed protein product [Candidula unifasciata]